MSRFSIRRRHREDTDEPQPGGDRRRRVPSKRVASVAAGGVLVGAMVLGTATSSAHGGGPSVAEPVDPAALVVAQVVSAAPTALVGFAPPAPRPVVNAPLPQFRIAADLPSGPLGIPGVVLQAYKLAAARVGSESPQCRLPWFLLAGIGRIESNHASNGSVDQYGTTINPILGPVLDGSLPGNEVIADGSGGHARAMGPMQFIPSTWAAWGSDANGDGKADPQNVFDATYSAGRYLCAGVTDIMNDNHKVAAVLRYNHSMEYVANVLSWAAAYATGVMPTNPIPEMRRPPASSSSKSSSPSKPPRSGYSTPPSSPAPSSSSTTPPPTCLGGFCVPTIPGLTLPPLPGQPTHKPAPRTAPGAGQPQTDNPSTDRDPQVTTPSQRVPRR